MSTEPEDQLQAAASSLDGAAVARADAAPGPRTVRVVAARWEADDTLSFLLADPSGAPLPEWEPGAHIDLVLPSGLVRQYSLCGETGDASTYRICVLRDRQSRGGSAEIHDASLVGRLLEIRGPRNHFRLKDAESYAFIAGGIGVTPLLPMIATVAARGKSWRLLYGARSRTAMAFAGELGALSAQGVSLIPEDELGRPDLAAFLAEAADGDEIYCCGPEGLIEAVEAQCARLGLSNHLNVERFSPSAMSLDAVAHGTDLAFEVELRRSGKVLQVPADRSMFEIIREALPGVRYSCTDGVCGECETQVISGQPDHRDSLLSEQERRESKSMMICVGRSLSPRLVLDL